MARDRHAPPAPPPPLPSAAVNGRRTAGAPVARRRHPWWLVAALAMIVAGVLVSAWVFNATSRTVRVLVAAHDLAPGEVLDDGAIHVVSISKLGGVRSIAAGEQDQVVGLAARGPIPAGTLLHAGLVAKKGDVVPAGQIVVGAALDPGAVPSSRIAAGDVVQLFATARLSATSAVPTDAATPLGVGRVWSVEKLGTGASSSNKLWLAILVPADAGAAVTQAAGDGRLRLVLVGTGQ